MVWVKIVLLLLALAIIWLYGLPKIIPTSLLIPLPIFKLHSRYSTATVQILHMHDHMHGLLQIVYKGQRGPCPYAVQPDNEDIVAGGRPKITPKTCRPACFNLCYDNVCLSP